MVRSCFVRGSVKRSKTGEEAGIMANMHNSYGIPRGAVPQNLIQSMASRFPIPDSAGNPDTLVYLCVEDGKNTFKPSHINGEEITLEIWESYATQAGKDFVAAVRIDAR